MLGSRLGVSLLSVADCPLLLALLSRLADSMEGSGAVSGTSSWGMQAARAKREAARARYTGLKVRVDTLEVNINVMLFSAPDTEPHCGPVTVNTGVCCGEPAVLSHAPPLKAGGWPRLRAAGEPFRGRGGQLVG